MNYAFERLVGLVAGRRCGVIGLPDMALPARGLPLVLSEVVKAVPADLTAGFPLGFVVGFPAALAVIDPALFPANFAVTLLPAPPIPAADPTPLATAGF